MSRLRSPRDSRECRRERLGLMAGGRRIGNCASELERWRDERITDSTSTSISSSSSSSRLLTARMLSRERTSRILQSVGPLKLERRGDVPVVSRPRRARGGYHGRMYYPYGRIISGGTTGARGCDASRGVHVHFPPRFYRPACVLSRDAPSLSLSSVPSRDPMTTDDNERRRRRRSPRAASYEGVREKEMRTTTADEYQSRPPRGEFMFWNVAAQCRRARRA